MSHQDKARHNALVATQALVQRRLERDEADYYLALIIDERYGTHRHANGTS